MQQTIWAAYLRKVSCSTSSHNQYDAWNMKMVCYYQLVVHGIFSLVQWRGAERYGSSKMPFSQKKFVCLSDMFWKYFITLETNYFEGKLSQLLPSVVHRTDIKNFLLFSNVAGKSLHTCFVSYILCIKVSGKVITSWKENKGLITAVNQGQTKD